MEEERKVVEESGEQTPAVEEKDGLEMLKEGVKGEAPTPAKEEVKKAQAGEPEAAAEAVIETPKGPTPEELEQQVKEYIAKLRTPHGGFQMPKPTTVKDETGKELSYEDLVEQGRIAEAMDKKGYEIANNVVQQLMMGEAKAKAFKERESSNAAVYKKHPELMKIDAGEMEPNEFAIEMGKVYKEFPHLMTNEARGPEAAMSIAEQRLTARGVNVGKVEKKAVEEAKIEEKVEATGPSQAELAAAKEAERQNASRAAAVVASYGGAAPEKPVSKKLTDSEKFMAAKLGMTESEYVAMTTNTPVFTAEYYAKYKNAHIRPRGGSK